jgi:GNAT superfamily N-acetyltransferase
MDENTATLLNLRVIEVSDYQPLAELMDLVFPDVGGAWPKSTIMQLVTAFPDGQICIEDNGKIVAAALTLKVSYNRFSLPHTYSDIITDDGVVFHDAKGDALYGLDVFVHPDYRGHRLGRRLYEARKDLCQALNLKAILAGGRIPGYHKHTDVSVTDYINKVRRKEIHDPILSFQLSNCPKMVNPQVTQHYWSGITSFMRKTHHRCTILIKPLCASGLCNGRCATCYPLTTCSTKPSFLFLL